MESLGTTALNHTLHCIQAIHKQFMDNFNKFWLKMLKNNQIGRLCGHHHNMTQATSASHLFHSIKHHIFSKSKSLN